MRERRHALFERSPRRAVGQDRDRRAVPEHVGQPLGRVARIKRHIGAAGLVDREQAHHHLEAALGADRDPVVRPHAQGAQMMGEAVGAGVEFRVGQPFAVANDRDRIGRPRDLGFDKFVHAFVLRIVGLGRVPLDQHPMPFGGVELRRTFGFRRLAAGQARRLDRRRGYARALERVARLMIRIPQWRPQNCCSIRDLFPVGRGAADIGRATPLGPQAPAQDGAREFSLEMLTALEQSASGAPSYGSRDCVRTW